MSEAPDSPKTVDLNAEKAMVYRVLRYAPDPERDEWMNIGVLLFDHGTGERRVRLIESEEEYRRVRRMVPRPDEALLRALRAELESQFEVLGKAGSGGRERNGEVALAGQGPRIPLSEWEGSLSNALQLSPQKGLYGGDLDSELERLYENHVAVPQALGRATAGRSSLRSYCSQVFKQAHIWDRLEKSVRVTEFTFPGDPMRIDYAYRRNGMRGFVQTLAVTRAPSDVKELAYTVKRIAERAPYGTEFAAVTDVVLMADNERQQFVRETLRDAGVVAVPREGFAVWVAKLRPLLN